LYRTAVRVGQNELRRQIRRSRYEKLFGFVRGTPTPEELLVVRQEQQRVDLVLSVLEPRQTELLVLRSYGFSYDELASTLDLNPSSVGTFLSRVQQAFRKEVIAGCGGVAAGISGDHLIHTLNLPKHSLHTPKKTLRQARQADPL
jgi:RNA polymerase sigma-70 factor (ECF subfamily)